MAVDEGTVDRPIERWGGGRIGGEGWRSAVAVGARLAAAAALVLVAVLGVRLATRPGVTDAGAASGGWAGLLLALLALVLALAVVVLRPERGDVGRLIRTAAVWTAALLATLAGLWYLVDADVREDVGIGTPVTDQAAIEAYLADALPAGETPLVVPTGVLIQSIEFLNANNVEVAGFVWQRYDASIPADVARGVVLPEAVDDAYQTEQAYTVQDGDAQVVGWRVHATLRQPFDYRRYPFDRQDVRLRLWPQEAAREILLVPDFGAYADAAPAALPGLDPNFVYGGWNPEYAAFSYAEDRSSIGGALGEKLPDLYFNVGLQRDFVGPFLDHVLLTTAVALLLFLLLALTTNDDDLQRRFGFNTAGVVGSASGLLFAVILKHNQIRSAVAVHHIAYLEVLPILLYGFIVLVALNAILLASPLNMAAIEFKKNVLPTVAFWPALLGALLAVTVVVFYL